MRRSRRAGLILRGGRGYATLHGDSRFSVAGTEVLLCWGLGAARGRPSCRTTYPGLHPQRQRAAFRAAACRWITACTCVGRGRSSPRSSPHRLSDSASRVSRKCRASHAWWLSQRSATARPTTAAASRAQGSWPPGRHDAAPKVTGHARAYCWSTAAPRDACPRPSTPAQSADEAFHEHDEISPVWHRRMPRHPRLGRSRSLLRETKKRMSTETLALTGAPPTDRWGTATLGPPVVLPWNQAT